MGRRYRDLTPEAKAKAIARGKLNLAIYYGKVKRQPCWCGATPAEAHHEDYSKPLDVRWLCPPHHQEADRVKRHRDEGEAMSRIKPNEVAQAQRFSAGRERVEDNLIERYREIAANARPCDHARVAEHYGAMLEELSNPLAADMRVAVDRAFDVALGESRR
jgi:hypothetical protein